MFREIGDERAFDGILNQIIENIQNGSLKAGAALPAERTMAETMGVSRPAVREVLRALELLGIVKPVPGGGNYITEDLDTWLIGPLSILFKLNNGYLRQNQQFRAALERESAILAARKCTPLNAAELWMILARLDAAEDEKIRGELDRELHQKIAKIADNPMIYSVLAAADQLTENIRTFSDLRPLNKQEKAALTKIADRMIAQKGVPCTACGYCIEKCVKGLNIPELIKAYNDNAPYEGIGPEACIGCRRCEPGSTGSC